MKRLIALAVLVMMVFGASFASAATTFKASGQYDFAWGWTDNLDFNEDDGEDDFAAEQRFRFSASFIQDEYLAGYANFEIGDIVWGRGAGAVGTQDLDSTTNALELRHLYIDWYVPNTDLMFRMGKFAVDFQSVVAGNAIHDDTVSGILASYKVNDMVSVLAAWARIADVAAADAAADPADDEADAFILLLPLTFDGISGTPFFVYGMAGADSTFNFGSNQALVANTDGAYAWWAGTSLVVDMFDPIVFKADFNYGFSEVETAGDDFESSGWYGAAKIQYKMDMMTPGILGWYASGEDDDNGESERMPVISPSFAATDLAFDGGNTRIGGSGVLGLAPQGTWGLGFELADISFMEGLTHDARVVYISGTNEDNAAFITFDSVNGFDLTEKDSIVEVDFNSAYAIYDNLSLLLDINVMFPNLDDDRAAVANNEDETAWRVAVGLSYSF